MNHPAKPTAKFWLFFPALKLAMFTWGGTSRTLTMCQGNILEKQAQVAEQI